MHRSPASEIALSPDAWERIAKDWLVEVIERTPLDDVAELPIGWMARDAAPLIAEILGQLSDYGSARGLELPPGARDRAAALAAERPAGSSALLPRELAALQSLIVEALSREVGEQDRGEFTRAVSRLAEVFGAVQSAALQAVSGEPSEVLDAPGLDETPEMSEADAPLPVVDALDHEDPSDAELLHEQLKALIGEYRLVGIPFALAHVEIDGFERIADAYGGAAAERMVNAVMAVVESQSQASDRAFRVAIDQIVLVRERSDAAGLAALGEKLSEVVESSQSIAGPRVAVTVGLSSFPQNGETPESLLDSAEQAAWRAASSGADIAIAASVPDP